jgi:predicted nuclease of predicted toxin-antitoxin system
VKRFLLDANRSPRTATFLIATFGFDVVAPKSLGLAHLDDEQVIEMAKREKCFLIAKPPDW